MKGVHISGITYLGCWFILTNNRHSFLTQTWQALAYKSDSTMSKRLITQFFVSTRPCSRQKLNNAVNSEPTEKYDAKIPSDEATAAIKEEDTTTVLKEVPSSLPEPSIIDKVKDLVGSEWAKYLDDELKKPYFRLLWSKVAKDRIAKKVYPPEHLVFNAFKLVPLSKIKVVIVGQDPYHQPRQAMGLSFSVPKGVPLPPSLRNIFKEIGIESTHGDLTYWAQQGVFMLNTVLTVIDSQAFSHKEYGWQTFTDRVIQLINTHCSNVVFLLWGKPAQKKCESISGSKHCILKCGHPSPLSQKFFFGCDHFNKCNEYLKINHLTPIDWKLPL